MGHTHQFDQIFTQIHISDVALKHLDGWTEKDGNGFQ
jgi:hypothetical protein